LGYEGRQYPKHTHNKRKKASHCLTYV